MADTPTPTKPTRGFHIRQGLAIALAMLGGRVMRFSLIALALLGVGWLLYTNAFTPLQEPVGAPEGVPDINPMIATDLLQEINARGAERLEFRPRSFTLYERFFAPQPANTPAVNATSSPALPPG